MGQILAGHYEIQDKLGSGGMGTVYRGVDTRTDEIVAIKHLTYSDNELIERFKREGEALRDLNHPNIVKMLNTLEHDGQHYLVMEYVSGGDLADLLKVSRLPLEKILNLAIDLADALTRAHRLDIIHRDLKPANVLIGEDDVLRLTDFGVAHVGSKERVTDTNAIVGTIDYLSPEALNGDPIDTRMDIWAFGVMLFEMIAGERPFAGQGIVEVVQAISMQDIPDLEDLAPDAPIALVDLIYRMLERDPQARISSVRHIGAALEDVLHGRESQPHTPRFETPVPEFTLRTKHNLPAQTTPFVGREHELAELDKLLRDPAIRLITVLAPGGMGKTRLSLAAAEQQLENFADGVYFVELAPLSDPENIISAIADATGYQFQSDGRNPNQQILDFLSHKNMLLVMDNYEHLMTGAGLVTDILNAASDVQILATSRQRLSQPGEVLFHLSGMDFPAWETPEDALDYAAVKLFMNSAKRARPDFELTGNNLDHVARICKLVQGMPLGIVLAAAWLSLLSISEVAEEIQQGLDFLETDETELPERQRSIRAVMDYSWQQMTDAEQQVFMKFSVFRGGFTREAAGEIAGANLRVLMSLLNKSLIRRDADSGRYEIHELLRQFAYEQLEYSQQASNTYKKHSYYYADLSEQADPGFHTSKQMYWRKTLEAEHDNIRAVLQRSFNGLNPEYGIQIVGNLRYFWRYHDHHLEAFRWCQLAISFENVVNPRLYARMLLTMSSFADMSDVTIEPSKMEQYLLYALDILREHGTIGDLIRALNQYFALYRDFYPEQVSSKFPYIEEALQLSRTLDDPAFLSQTLSGLSMYYILENDYKEAQRCAEESLAITIKHGNILRQLLLRSILGRVFIEQKQHTRAVEIIREMLRTAIEAQLPSLLLMSLFMVAITTILDSQMSRGVRLLGISYAYKDASGAGIPSIVQGGIDLVINRAKTELALEKYQRLYDEGYQMTYAEGIEFALKA